MTTAPARRGFTLVELLVVVALLALLAALSAGAYFRIQASEKNRAAEATLSKLNTLHDRRWKAVLDTASQDALQSKIPDLVVQFAGGDKDRARAVWTYMRLKNEFPTTRAEAVTDVVIPGTAVVVLQHRKIFDQLPNSGTPEEQSAACLYLALTATGNRGETVAGDGLEQQTADINLTGGGSARVFVDPWAQPIIYFRMGFAPELNLPPYIRSGVQNRDLCDPLGKLTQAQGTWTAASLNLFWAAMAQNHIGAGTVVPATYPIPSQNWVPTAVSAGPDKAFGAPTYFDGDNLVGFRLRREGNRGD